MKRAILTLQALFLIACLASASDSTETSATFYFNDKMIEVDDNDDQVDVRVFKQIGEGDYSEYTSVYEGVFSEEKSVEKYTVFEDLGFDIPFINKEIPFVNNKKPRKMTAHWSGWSVGFSNMIQEVGPGEFKLAEFGNDAISGVEIRPENSLEWTLNLSEKIMPLYKDLFGLTMGFGLSWRNYCLENNTHFVVNNGITELTLADPGVKYSRSRLRTLYLTFPLMLEWQPRFGNDHKTFVTAGIVGGLRGFANYKVTYIDNTGEKIKRKTAKELNTRLLNLDYMVQVGHGNFGFYAKYCPFSFFTKGDGPDAQAVSIGVIFR